MYQDAALVFEEEPTIVLGSAKRRKSTPVLAHYSLPGRGSGFLAIRKTRAARQDSYLFPIFINIHPLLILLHYD